MGRFTRTGGEAAARTATATAAAPGTSNNAEGNWINLGSVSETKSGKLQCKIYPPKGVDTVELRRGDKVFFFEGKNENDPEWVVGRLVLLDEDK